MYEYPLGWLPAVPERSGLRGTQVYGTQLWSGEVWSREVRHQEAIHLETKVSGLRTFPFAET